MSNKRVAFYGAEFSSFFSPGDDSVSAGSSTLGAPGKGLLCMFWAEGELEATCL